VNDILITSEWHELSKGAAMLSKTLKQELTDQDFLRAGMENIQKLSARFPIPVKAERIIEVDEGEFIRGRIQSLQGLYDLPFVNGRIEILEHEYCKRFHSEIKSGSGLFVSDGEEVYQLVESVRRRGSFDQPTYATSIPDGCMIVIRDSELHTLGQYIKCGNTIKPLGDSERERLEQTIGGLCVLLSKSKDKWLYGAKPNSSQISTDVIVELNNETTFGMEHGTLSKRLSRGIALFKDIIEPSKKK